MTDLNADKNILMKFIDGVYEQQISREQIEQRVEMFAVMVAKNQIEACALWVEESVVMECPLVTDSIINKNLDK